MNDGDRWPAPLRGVTETVIATLGPNDQWNHAALGVHADAHADVDDERSDGENAPPSAATAYTYGNTRTRRNLEREGSGVVQFTPDPVDFTEAALGVLETTEPVLDSTAAWVRVDATMLDERTEAGTPVATWRLDPGDATVRERVVPTINRGHAAVVEATVAGSRLGLDDFDDEALRDRLEYALDVARTCGGPRERLAIRRVAALTDAWQPDPDALPDSDELPDE
jgi:hypothetical protein